MRAQRWLLAVLAVCCIVQQRQHNGLAFLACWTVHRAEQAENKLQLDLSQQAARSPVGNFNLLTGVPVSIPANHLVPAAASRRQRWRRHGTAGLPLAVLTVLRRGARHIEAGTYGHLQQRLPPQVQRAVCGWQRRQAVAKCILTHLYLLPEAV